MTIGKTFVLPVVALAIAALTGLISFFRWENSWKDFSLTEYALEHAFWTWELSIVEARYEVDVQKAIDITIQATKQLLDQVQDANSTLGEEFFKRVQVPHTR